MVRTDNSNCQSNPRLVCSRFFDFHGNLIRCNGCIKKSKNDYSGPTHTSVILNMSLAKKILRKQFKSLYIKIFLLVCSVLII